MAEGVRVVHRNGVGPIDEKFMFSPGIPWKLVYVRVHFREVESGGSPGTPDLDLSVESSLGDEYNCLLFRAESRGIGSDANIVVLAEERQDPSPWSFLPDDQLHVEWAASDETVGWGIEVGYE